MKAWEQFLLQQEAELGKDTVHKWLRPLRILHYDAGNLYLEASDSFQIMWFEEHVRPKLQKTFINNNKRKIQVHIKTVGVEEKKLIKAKNPAKKVGSQVEVPTFTLQFDVIDPRCKLENFVVNDNNILAHKLLCKILNNTEELATFNPVYIHGAAGTGKSHLLMGVVQALSERGFKVNYTKAETFTEHVITAIRAGEMSVFRQSYRASDVLIIDDVHLFSRKNATQEELFHTFNTLHLAGKQIILAANCAPGGLQLIEPRLVSRFEWGIVLGLEPLSTSDIRRVLEHKMEAINFHLNAKVIDFLLEMFPTGTKALTRALEALVLRTHLREETSSISPTQLSTAQVRYSLQDLIEHEQKNVLTPIKIVQTVAEHYGIRSEDILGKMQTRECVLPRQISIYICRLLLHIPFIKIGEFFSRDHSTVMSSNRVIKDAIAQGERSISTDCALLLKRLQQ